MRLLKNILELLFWSLIIGLSLLLFSLLIGWLLAPFLGYFSFLMIVIAIPLIVRIAATRPGGYDRGSRPARPK